MVDITTLETSSLGDRSYLVSDGTVAAVVDPQRDIDRVLDAARRLGVRITHVFETHVHNDYVTGGFQLARETGAAYHLHADDEVQFDRVGLRDGDSVDVGTLRFTALHTPGHTPTHLSYVVHSGGRDVAVFTGGSLLYGTVGRTDLISRAMAEELSRLQHRSARRLADLLDDDVSVMPTHGFGSFCSSTPAGEGTDASTIGRERSDNLALTVGDEDAFVERLLSGLDAYPRYYAHMAPRNRLGPEPVDLTPPVPADPTELCQRIHAGEWVVDLRTRTLFAADHLRGTVNIEVGDTFTTYLGWLVPWNRPLTLVGDTPDEVAEAQRQLVRIGIDRPAAAATGGVEVYGAGGDRGKYEVADFAELARAHERGERPVVLDVRREDERAQGGIPDALHIPVHDLERRVDEVPTGEVWVHCASGYRSAVAASLLARAGRTPVLIDDEYERAVELGLTGETAGARS
ncbi:MAG TPA: MBL fold metallo-hydrolase [Euzebyales bacterium]|nr:MBL fold metallo-hydrolase [Euzebyales bacterium]